MDGGPDRGVRIELVRGDALEVDADVLVLKYAQALHGVDRQVYLRFEWHEPERDLPDPGRTYLATSPAGVASREVLFVGTRPIDEFDYSDLRELGRVALTAIGDRRPDARHVAMTLHGVGFGLDEEEACEAQIAGLLDAIHSGSAPAGLERVSIVEHGRGRFSRLQPVVELLRSETTAAPRLGHAPAGRPDRLARVGAESNRKPHVFVAMPFDQTLDDLYYYGIQSAVKAGGYLCERADLATFTGDVISWVKRRISTGQLVVAELTGANANVYLEVGYAWGTGVPTILVARHDEKLLFDVRGQRCLLYESIRDLEVKLTDEISGLVGDGAR